MKILFSLLLSCLFSRSFAQQQSNDTTHITSRKVVHYQLGNKRVTFKIIHYRNRNDWTFINLHDDEQTSVEAARLLLHKKGGVLVHIENNKERNVYFKLGHHWYGFDPNRIFTRKGIIQTLSLRSKYDKKAADAIQDFARWILKLVPPGSKSIIALHNNKEGFYSVESYKAGNYKTWDARKVYIDPGQASDDLFLTTDDTLYEALANKQFNTVLQDNLKCRDDGSLSVYYGRKNMRYVNCETLHGKKEQYLEMIGALTGILEKMK